MRKIASVLAAAMLFSCTTAPRKTASTSASLDFDRASLDPATNACADFWQYANGGWLAKNPIPPQYPTWGMMSKVGEENRKILREVLEGAANKPAAQRTANEQKIGDYYRSCMDEARIDAAGIEPLRPHLDAIAAISSPGDLPAVFARLHAIGVDAPFDFHSNQDAKNSAETIAEVSQDGLGLPDRDYYFRTDEKSKTVRAEYAGHIRKMMELAGLRGDAEAIMGLETALAEASMTAVEQRDPTALYNRMPVTQLASLAPSVDWSSYFGRRGYSVESINVSQPKFFEAVNRLMTSTPIEEWKAYLRWQLLTDTASALSTPIAQENFRFRNGVILGQKKEQDRWERCVNRANAQIGEALGQAYVDRKFPPEAKRRALELVHNLEAALRESIGELQWMGEETRQQALAKLEAFRYKIGYPDVWRDYSALTIGDAPLATNVLSANAFAVKRDLDKIGKPIDRNEWYMTPPTINAYFAGSLNEIVFPAGILQWPMFDINQDDAFNYGAIGSVIGHELTHAFDDEGSRYDNQGNLRNWWTAEDRKRFEARAECIIQQFNKYEIEPGVAHNGKLVAGESIADLGGLIIAYEAWQKSLQGKPRPQPVDGFTPDQRFFLGFARSRAANQTIEWQRNRVLSDPHPVSKFRVNGPLSNMPQFASAFQCRAGEAMVRAERCEIW